MNTPKHKTPTRPLYISIITWLALIPLAMLVGLAVAASALYEFCDKAFVALSEKVLVLREVRE